MPEKDTTSLNPKGVCLDTSKKKPNGYNCLNVTYDWIALIIAVSAFIFFFCLVGHYVLLKQTPQAKPTPIIAYKTIYIDTLLPDKKTRTLIDSIQKQNVRIIDSLRTFSNVLDSYRAEKNDFSDKFKIVLSIVGLIFTITGFFGLKSINDTRQNAIDKAVFDSKEIASSKAKEIADIVSKQISADKAEEVALLIAETVAKSETERVSRAYFNDKFPDYFQKWEETYKATVVTEIDELKERTDKLERPDAFGIINPIDEAMVKELRELRVKYSELLDIVEKMRIEGLTKK